LNYSANVPVEISIEINSAVTETEATAHVEISKNRVEDIKDSPIDRALLQLKLLPMLQRNSEIKNLN